MPFVVKLTCQGTAEVPHPVRTVAQFRYDDDGWVRVHDREKRDQIAWTPDGDMSMLHRIACGHPGCRRAEARLMPAERLYPALDYAREHGKPELPLR